MAPNDPSLDAVWATLQPLFIAKRNQIFALMAAHELTPPHGQALSMLADGPMRMRDVADNLVCDASYVTVIVDNLEAKGFAIRRPSATDRRVKEIALTPSGLAAALEIRTAMSSPPPALQVLAKSDRLALARILAKLDVGESQPFWARSATRA